MDAPTPTMIQALLEKVRHSTATAEECEQLLQLVNGPEAEEVTGYINRYYEAQRLVFTAADDARWKEMVQQIVSVDKDRREEVAPVRRMFGRAWYKVAAAAVITLLLGTGIYFLLPKKKETSPEIATTVDVQAPQTNRATIQLSNGQTVFLDSVGAGELALQGNIQLVKLAGGQIAYQTVGGEMLTEPPYNTLTNPRGSKVIDLQLSDGSHVWLNAGSSVRYPVAFRGKERKVSITGEAYFEVTHNAAMPFKVSKDNMEVVVLGTHFNVNAYEDEKENRVTLLEGSVKVKNSTKEGLLRPGQQARIASEMKIVNDVDLAAVMAWKNGLFNFEGMSLKEAMMQVERWYDIKVEYEPDVPDAPLFGTIGRNLSLTDLLEVLGGAGFRFRLEAGRKLVLMK